jgi:hypothetical protein
MLFLFLTKNFRVDTSFTGKFLVGTSLAGILIVFSILFLILYQVSSPKKDVEREFARGLLKAYETDVALEVIEKYRNESFVASVLLDKRINTVDLAREIVYTIRQGHVRKFIDYLEKRGKSDDALGYVLRHLIAHKKIPSDQSIFLERELRRYLPKRDVIGKLYERE